MGMTLEPHQTPPSGPSTPDAGADTTTAAGRPAAASAATASAARGRSVGVLLLVLLVVGLGVGIGISVRHRGRVTTDDAQVDGRIVPVLARVGGYVAEVAVADNQAVTTGSTLVTVDDRDLRARLQQTEADVATAEAVVGSRERTGQAAAQLEAAREAVTEAEANAERADSDLARARALGERNIISRQELERAQTTAASARSQLEAARDQVNAAGAGLQAARARLASAIASRDQAALMLSYARITTPVDGVVSKKNVEVGQLVQPGQQLLSVVKTGDLWIVANLKETQLRDVRPGDPVEVRIDTYPGHVFRATVESIGAATGARFSLLPPDNATGNFNKVVQRIPVKIALSGPADPARPLRPGMSAVVTIRARRPPPSARS